jgi:hypothetical protein
MKQNLQQMKLTVNTTQEIIEPDKVEHRFGNSKFITKIKKLLCSFLLTLLVTVTIPTTARSQAALLVLLFGDMVASENFYFSLKLGGNVSTLSGIDNSKMADGLNFGVMASIKLSKEFYLVPEFMALSPKGVKNIPFRSTGNASLDQAIQPTTSTAKELNYIDIPIVAKYYITKSLGIELGPQVSILTSGKDIFRGKIKEDDDLVYSDNIKSSLNTFDVGVVAGLTYSLWDARKGKGLFIHARYAYGFMDIVKDNPGSAQRNSVFQLSVSFPFINPPDEKESKKK